jgi:hypothetical protein
VDQPVENAVGYRGTTERYLGCTQRISSAVNDRIGIEPFPAAICLLSCT